MSQLPITEKKIPEKNNLKERFDFGLPFRGFSPWSLDSVGSEPVLGQNIMAGNTW